MDLQKGIDGIVEMMKGLCPAGVGMRKETRQRNVGRVSLAKRTTGGSGNKEWIARGRSTARAAEEGVEGAGGGRGRGIERKREGGC